MNYFVCVETIIPVENADNEEEAELVAREFIQENVDKLVLSVEKA